MEISRAGSRWSGRWSDMPRWEHLRKSYWKFRKTSWSDKGEEGMPLKMFQVHACVVSVFSNFLRFLVRRAQKQNPEKIQIKYHNYTKKIVKVKSCVLIFSQTFMFIIVTYFLALYGHDLQCKYDRTRNQWSFTAHWNRFRGR